MSNTDNPAIRCDAAGRPSYKRFKDGTEERTTYDALGRRAIVDICWPEGDTTTHKFLYGTGLVALHSATPNDGQQAVVLWTRGDANVAHFTDEDLDVPKGTPLAPLTRKVWIVMNDDGFVALGPHGRVRIFALKRPAEDCASNSLFPNNVHAVEVTVEGRL